jgi:beta-mannosidase
MSVPTMTPAAVRRSLTDGWRLRPAQPLARFSDLEVVAEVPGCVHTDLLRAGLLPDPFVDNNEHEVAWVADTDWVYDTSFAMTAAMFDHDRTSLLFEGLDTLATITLNGASVGVTGNMHRRYRFDVTDKLRDGDNQLVVAFRSATRHAEALRSLDAAWPSASFGRPYNYVRKMACSWGWDWGPWLTTAGIWKPVSVHSWSTARIASVRPMPSIDEDDRGTVAIGIALERSTTAPVTVRASLVSPDDEVLGSIEAPATATDEADSVTISAGTVHRWWPSGQGAQPLYTVVVELLDQDGHVIDHASHRIGFRSVRLDTSADATGSAFTLVVNGVPIFAKGVNWIPDDVFPSRVTPARVRDRLEAARAANVDLVRVWGGGLYESDAFYDICDELGLLVWQDFCFACASYPEELLAAEVEAETRDNVERLMPHPSLALWNGNNENIWGWFDWGWQRTLDGRSWGAGFYFDLLPRVVSEIDPARPYWPGSPYSGSMSVAPNSDPHGCTHVWDVWNQLDYERYRDHAPRFVAEFGWQAPPTWQTLRESITDEPLTPTSSGMANHQKAQDGDAKLRRGLRAHVGEPDDFDQWWWATQLMQARAVTTGIEHFRSLRGTCMGTVWWQLNDCWPVTSWSVIDSSGQPKPAWFALRSAYRPQLLTVQPRGSSLIAAAINDSRDHWSIDGTIRRIGFDGTVHTLQVVDLQVAAGSIASVVIADEVARPEDASCELIVFDGAGERAMWWFKADKETTLDHPQLTLETVSSDETSMSVVVHAQNLVRDLAIMPDRIAAGARCSDQLVTLLPGEHAAIDVIGLPHGHTLTAADLSRPPILWSAYSAVHPTGIPPSPD